MDDLARYTLGFLAGVGAGRLAFMAARWFDKRGCRINTGPFFLIVFLIVDILCALKLWA